MPVAETDPSYWLDTIHTLQQAIHRLGDGQAEPQARQLWRNSSQPTLKDLVHVYAPFGLESQFEQLYGLLHPCLVGTVDRDSSNAAAFLLGHRGMGKGLLLERCLQAFRDELDVRKGNHTSFDRNKRTPTFRMVTVHGVLVPGEDVSCVVRELLQQLSQVALQETADMDQDEEGKATEKYNHKNKSQTKDDNDEKEHQDEEEERRKRKRRKKKHDEYLLRLRQSSFESNLQLLGETLKLARVDQIPILIVLDEVDAFIGSSSSNHKCNNASTGVQVEKAGGRDRQLLLYHLLDRVATQGSNVCLVGMTSFLGFKSLLEKRIRSRMEGTSKEIFVGPCPTMTSLVSLLLSRVGVGHSTTATSTTININEEEEEELTITATSKVHLSPLQMWHRHLSELLSPTPKTSNQEDTSRTAISKKRVWDTLEREYRTGRNVRWFSRILAIALSLYRGECLLHRRRLQQQQQNSQKKPPAAPRLQASHIIQALAAQGASLPAISKNASATGQSSQQQQRGQSKNSRKRQLVVIDGSAVDPRIQILMDLSKPQVVLVLAARRILARDGQRSGEVTSPPPLTLGRMMQEYQSCVKGGNANHQRYGRHLLHVAFQEMVDMNLLRPAADHVGTGPFQYDHTARSWMGNSGGNCSMATVMEDVPLHLLVDIHRELLEALNGDLLDCTTAIKEWGKKTN